MANKRCLEYQNLLEFTISGELDSSAAEQVMNHIAVCPSCQDYWRALQDDDRLLSEFSQSMNNTVSRIEDIVLASIQNEAAIKKRTNLFWRWIMFSNWGRFTAATALILFSILVYSLTDRPGSRFTAWAEVLANVENADSFRYWERDLVSGHNKKTIVGGGFGYYREIYKNGRMLLREYWEEQTNSIVFFDDEEKKYGRMFLSEEQIAEAEELAPQNLLSRVLSFRHYDLGEKIVAGRMAAGIQVRDPSFEISKWDHTEAELWVDIETQLPLRFEMVGEAGHGKVRRHLLLEDFEWNTGDRIEDYRTGIPGDYELIVNIPEVVGDEEHTIEALKIFAGMTSGRFPSSLSMETAIQEVKGSLGQGESRFRDLEDAWKIYSAGKFYEQLLRDGKEPVYFGNQVRFGESDRVLLRWSTGADQYRAILGDLSTLNLSGDELLQLEH
jgi:hypothetical protein